MPNLGRGLRDGNRPGHRYPEISEVPASLGTTVA